MSYCLWELECETPLRAPMGSIESSGKFHTLTSNLPAPHLRPPPITLKVIPCPFFLNEGVLLFEMSVHQHASTPIGGNYTLLLESNTTVPLPHNASALEVRNMNSCRQLCDVILL